MILWLSSINNLLNCSSHHRLPTRKWRHLCHPNKMSETHRHQKNTTLGKTLIQNAASTHTLSSLTGSYTTCSQIIKSIYPVMEMTFGAIFNVGKFSSPFMNWYHFHHWDIFIFLVQNFEFFMAFSPFIPTLIHNGLDAVWKVVSQDPLINKQTSWSVSTFFQPTILQYTDHKAKTKCYHRKQSDHRFLSAKSPSDLFRNLLRGLSLLIFFTLVNLNLCCKGLTFSTC